MGRGFVQLTGSRNYADWSRRTGLHLLNEPYLVTQPAVAARILVQVSMLGTFTGKKLGDYASFTDMRRVINGTDREALTVGYAEKVVAALKAAAAAEPAPLPPAEPTKTNADVIRQQIKIIRAGLDALEELDAIREERRNHREVSRR